MLRRYAQNMKTLALTSQQLVGQHLLDSRLCSVPTSHAALRCAAGVMTKIAGAFTEQALHDASQIQVTGFSS
jgi:hypothetical protein